MENVWKILSFSWVWQSQLSLLLQIGWKLGYDLISVNHSESYLRLVTFSQSTELIWLSHRPSLERRTFLNFLSFKLYMRMLMLELNTSRRWDTCISSSHLEHTTVLIQFLLKLIGILAPMSVATQPSHYSQKHHQYSFTFYFVFEVFVFTLFCEYLSY